MWKPRWPDPDRPSSKTDGELCVNHISVITIRKDIKHKISECKYLISAEIEGQLEALRNSLILAKHARPSWDGSATRISPLLNSHHPTWVLVSMTSRVNHRSLRCVCAADSELTVHNGVGQDGGHGGLLGKELDGVQQACGVHPLAG